MPYSTEFFWVFLPNFKVLLNYLAHATSNYMTVSSDLLDHLTKASQIVTQKKTRSNTPRQKQQTCKHSMPFNKKKTQGSFFLSIVGQIQGEAFYSPPKRTLVSQDKHIFIQNNLYSFTSHQLNICLRNSNDVPSSSSRVSDTEVSKGL